MTRPGETGADILLLSPPVGNFAQVHPAICLLAAYLRSAGIRAVQRDLAIDCFHYFHAREYLSALKAREQASLEQRARSRFVDQALAGELSAKLRLVLLLDRVSRAVEDAKAELRDPMILDDPSRLAAALRVLKDVGRGISAAHPGQHFNFQEFRIEGAFADWHALNGALTDPARNLLLPYVENLDLPPARCVGLSVTYPAQLLPALCVAQKWRRTYPAAPIIVGGSYVTQMAETFLVDHRWFDNFDFLVLGDGEAALVALAREGWRPADPAAIPNLCFRAGTEVRRSHQRSRTDLRQLPVPMLEFDGIDLDAYVAPAPVVALPISRGCYWGKCTFCNISNQAEDPYRVRSVDQVVGDIEALISTVGTPYFDFCVNSYHPAGLHKLSLALIEAGLDIRWNAEVLLDPKFTPECLAAMAQSGCRHLRFGFKSANAATLAIMQKRNDRAVVDRILHDCRALDIKVSLMSIIGFPTESADEAWNTIDYYLERSEKIAFVTLHRFNVSAGSPIMQNPSLCNIALERIPGLLQPRYRYTNNNPQGMSSPEVAALLPQCEAAIRRKYPQHAEIHTAGIGGWLTFLACCRHEASFFKQPIDVETRSPTAGRARGSERHDDAPPVGFASFAFDVPALEEIARGRRAPRVLGTDPHSALLSADGQTVTVFPGDLAMEFAAVYGAGDEHPQHSRPAAPQSASIALPL